jgi:group I intron endonuclease
MKIINTNNVEIVLSDLSLKKAGVYLITNKVNTKKYVGSSVLLNRRFKEYMSRLYIERNLEKGKSKILKALLVYGFTKIEIKILETIQFLPSLNRLERRKYILEREQYYIDELKPEYNLKLN